MTLKAILIGVVVPFMVVFGLGFAVCDLADHLSKTSTPSNVQETVEVHTNDLNVLKDGYSLEYEGYKDGYDVFTVKLKSGEKGVMVFPSHDDQTSSGDDHGDDDTSESDDSDDRADL